MTFTNAAIYALAAPPVGRLTIHDSRLTQLALTLGPKSRTWYVIATVHRLTRRVRLGRFPLLEVDEARQWGLEALRRLHAGEDPRERRTPSLTLRQALDSYLAGRDLRPASAADCRCVIELHAARWLDKPLTVLAAEPLAQQYRTVAAKSVSAANKLLRNLSAVVRRAAVAQGAGDPDIVKKARVLLGGVQVLAARDNLIPDNVQGKWFAAVSALPAEQRRLLLALALTGLRKDEARALARTGWAGGVLAVQQTKSGKPHTLPTGPWLAGVLNGGSGGRLFDVSDGELRGAYERIGEAIGHAWTPHDLRRGFATAAARLGVEELAIKRLLNHAPSGVTQKHYIRLTVDDLRKPMQAVETHLLKLWGVASPAAVAA